MSPRYSPTPVGAATIAGTVLLTIAAEAFATSYVPPRRPLSEEDLASLGSQCENVVVAKVLDAVSTMVPIPSKGERSFTVRKYLRLALIKNLKGLAPSEPFEANFGNWVGAAPSDEALAGLIGKQVLLFLYFRRGSCGISYHPFLPDHGLVLLDGLRDPWIERMERVIGRGSLDSLVARAVVICVGHRPLEKRSLDRLVVQEWIAGPGPRDTLTVFWPMPARVGLGAMLLFLGHNALGQLEPLDVGVGQFEVEAGNVVRLNQPLADLVREIRLRRFVHEARSTGAQSPRNQRSTRPPRD